MRKTLGVLNGSGDDHVIEANRIEWAWHAIASNASRGSGYTARYNVFLRVPRPKVFDQSGSDPPNWCLDTHANNGAETNRHAPPCASSSRTTTPSSSIPTLKSATAASC